MDYTNIDELINDFQLMIDDTSYDKEAQIYQLRLLQPILPRRFR